MVLPQFHESMTQNLPCPRCQDYFGWYEKIVMSYQQYYHKDGTPSHAVDTGTGRGGKRKFCYECSLDITDLIKGDTHE